MNIESKNTNIIYLVVLIITFCMLVFGSCQSTKKDEKTTSNSVPSITYRIDKGDYISPSDQKTKIRYYKFEEDLLFIKLKKINMVEANTVLYTVIFALKSTEHTSVTAFWDDTHKKYMSYKYMDNNLYGVEIVLNNREEMVILDINKNPMYLTFDDKYTYKYTMPEQVWKVASDYIIY